MKYWDNSTNILIFQVINDKDNDDYTPLYRAIQKRSRAVVEQLVKLAKVDVNVHLRDGSNIIHYAASNSSERILKFLVSLNSCRGLINEVRPNY